MRQELPGVLRHRRTRSNTEQHAIDMLRERGLDTSWYDKHVRRDAPVVVEQPSACSWFSIYILDGDHAWTKTRSGEKYMEYRTLNKPVDVPCYFCAACRARWASYEQATAHVGATS